MPWHTVKESDTDNRFFGSLLDSVLPSFGPPLNVDSAHAAFWVTGTGGRTDRDRSRDAIGIGRGQMNAQCAQILFEPRDLLGAGNRDNVQTLRQEPGEHEL